MKLEEFKASVEARLMELAHNNTETVNRILASMTEEIWNDYMNDFSDSPEGVNAVAGGMISGLI